jgi:hypothetical protein
MVTLALIHGGGDLGWYWPPVEAELRRRGHDARSPLALAGHRHARRRAVLHRRHAESLGGDGRAAPLRAGDWLPTHHAVLAPTASEREQRLDEGIGQDEQARLRLPQLEACFDGEADKRVPSPDDLASEFEEFLRRRRDEPRSRKCDADSVMGWICICRIVPSW